MPCVLTYATLGILLWQTDLTCIQCENKEHANKVNNDSHIIACGTMRFTYGAGTVAQKPRAHIALTENPSLVSSTHAGQLTTAFSFGSRQSAHIQEHTPSHRTHTKRPF